MTEEERISMLGPCMAIVHGPSMENYYGPFDNGKQAMEWADHQIFVGNVRSFSITPLRTPYRHRKHDDWWAGAWHQVTIADQEFPTKPWIKTKRRVWRQWRRNSYDELA